MGQENGLLMCRMQLGRSNWSLNLDSGPCKKGRCHDYVQYIRARRSSNTIYAISMCPFSYQLCPTRSEFMF